LYGWTFSWPFMLLCMMHPCQSLHSHVCPLGPGIFTFFYQIIKITSLYICGRISEYH
jgi:hypothetical protein